MALAAIHGDVFPPEWHWGAVCEAAWRAFGAKVAEVRTVGAGGMYAIRLGWDLASQSACACLRLRVPESDRAEALLSLLERELWPLFGKQAASSERTAQIGVARLTIFYTDPDEDSCWTFSTKGACPRGNHCRWPHVPPRSCTVDLEEEEA